MSTHLISDEDWAIISSSSDYDEDSTASSVIDPDGDTSSSEFTPDADHPLSGDAPDSTTSRVVTSADVAARTKNRTDPAGDSVCTIRPQDVKPDDSPRMPEVPSPVAEKEIPTTCGVMDARFRGWSKRIFKVMFSCCRQKLEATRAQNVQSVGLAHHAAFSLYSTLERHQEVLLYYFAVALSAVVFGFHYGPAVLAALRDFANDRIVQGLWATPQLISVSRLGFFGAPARTWKSRFVGSPASKGRNLLSQTPFFSSLGVLTDAKLMLTNKLSQLQSAIDPVRFNLVQWGTVCANSLGECANRLVPYVRGLDEYFSAANKYVTKHNSVVWKWFIAGLDQYQRFSLDILGRILEVKLNFPEQVTAGLLNLVNKVGSGGKCVLAQFGNFLLGSKRYLILYRSQIASLRNQIATFVANFGNPIPDIVRNLQQGTLAIGELGNSYFSQSKQLLLRYVNKGAFLSNYERFSSYGPRLTHHLDRSKEAFDSVSRKTYRLIWTDNDVLHLWCLWTKTLAK